MVVLNEHHWILGAAHFLEDRICKLHVRLAVIVPIGGSKQWSSVCDMAEGPQALIREAVVVAFLFLFRKPNPAQRVLGFVWRHRQSIINIDHFPVGIAATMRDPGSVTRAQNWFQCSN